MTNANFDNDLLLSHNVNPSLPIPTMHQALRIAMYDEYHARAVYTKVLERFGNVLPFANIVGSENRHIAELSVLFTKYGVEPVIDDWAPKVAAEATLVENCEVGVAAEIENIKMYDNLLPYAQMPDVRDAFFRLQAASFNNHLPAFRRCAASHYAQFGGFEDGMNRQQNKIQEELMNSIKGFLGGNNQTIGSIFSGLGTEFILGAAVGAVVVGLAGNGTISQLFAQNKQGEE